MNASRFASFVQRDRAAHPAPAEAPAPPPRAEPADTPADDGDVGGAYVLAFNEPGFVIERGEKIGSRQYAFFVGVHEDSTDKVLSLMFTWGGILIEGSGLKVLNAAFSRRAVGLIRESSGKGVTIDRIRFIEPPQAQSEVLDMPKPAQPPRRGRRAATGGSRSAKADIVDLGRRDDAGQATGPSPAPPHRG